MQQNNYGIFGLFIRHRLLANLCLVFIILLGAWSVLEIRTQMLPSFSINVIKVSASWPGASAQVIAEGVLKPLQADIVNIDNLRSVSGKASKGMANLIIEINPDQDIDEVLQKVKDQVNAVTGLPSRVELPIVRKITLYEDIMQLMVSAPTLLEATKYAREFKRELSDIGIPKIDIIGAPKRTVEITFKPIALHKLGTDLWQLSELIKAKNTSGLALGSITSQGKDKLIVVDNLADNLEALKQTHIILNGQNVALQDIADIKIATDAESKNVFYGGKNSINMIVYRLSETNALQAAATVTEWLQQKKQVLAPGIQVESMFEGWKYLKGRIMLLAKNGLGGLILVILLLYLFLPRGIAYWVAMGIPVSIAGALIIMHLSGLTINLLSLFGLIMSLGIIVDDNIVVAENSVSIFKNTGKAEYSAIQAVKNMFVPVCSSALTTVAAFMPLLLVGGIYGDVMRDVPLVMILVVMCSVLECLFILPRHLKTTFDSNPARVASKKPPLDNLFLGFKDKVFRPFINKCLGHRKKVLGVVVIFLFSATLLFVTKQVKFEFFPAPDFNFMTVDIKFTAGTKANNMHNYLRHIEKELKVVEQELLPRNNSNNFIKHVVTKLHIDAIGMSKSMESASIIVETTDPDQRLITNQEIIKRWKTKVRSNQPPNVINVSFKQPKAGPPGSDIKIIINGESQDKVQFASKIFEDYIKNINGVTNVKDDIVYGPREYHVDLLPKVARSGVDRNYVMRQIQAALNGIEIKNFYQDSEKIPVKVTMQDKFATDLGLEDIPIKVAPGRIEPLDNIAVIKAVNSVRQINTYDGKFSATVKVDVDKSIAQVPEVIKGINKYNLADLQDKYNVKIKFVGNERDQQQVMKDMLFGLVIGLTMIYIIIAVVSESLLWPILVMIIIPLAIFGSIYGHWLLHKNVSLLSLFGMFGLSGIVVNDSIILLLRYKELKHEFKRNSEAMVTAVCDRLRPVLLTSLTTMAGLLPLLFETSMQAQFLIPMAITMVFGLLFATILILVILPVLISFTD